jgi:hypothetical protein
MCKVGCKDGYANGATAVVGVRTVYVIPSETTDNVRISGPVARLAKQVLSQLSYRPEGTTSLQISRFCCSPQEVTGAKAPKDLAPITTFQVLVKATESSRGPRQRRR